MRSSCCSWVQPVASATTGWRSPCWACKQCDEHGQPACPGMLWDLAAPAYLVRDSQILDGVATNVRLRHTPEAVTILQARQAGPSAHSLCPQETFTMPLCTEAVHLGSADHFLQVNIHPAIALDHVSIVRLATFELHQLQRVSTLRRSVLATLMCRGPGAHHWMPLSCLEQLQGQHGNCAGLSYDKGYLLICMGCADLTAPPSRLNQNPEVSFVGQALPLSCQLLLPWLLHLRSSPWLINPQKRMQLKLLRGVRARPWLLLRRDLRLSPCWPSASGLLRSGLARLRAWRSCETVASP